MVDTNTFTRRIALALDLPDENVRPIAKSILEAELNTSWESIIKRQLKETRIGEHWNYVLDIKRAKYLARKIRGILPEPNLVVLDILSGTGTVSKALRDFGFEVIEVERIAHYPGLKDTGRAWDFDTERTKLENVSADVAIVLASMHHEAELDKFIGWLSKLDKIKQFIIIENLRTSETDFELHQRMDWFFNRCLNDFGADCPGWYWDKKQWEVLLGSLGKVQWLYTMNDVPGIPFAYDLFVINR